MTKQLENIAPPLTPRDTANRLRDRLVQFEVEPVEPEPLAEPATPTADPSPDSSPVLNPDGTVPRIDDVDAPYR